MAFSSSLDLFFSLLGITFCFHLGNADVVDATPYAAIFSFGDSLADTGNFLLAGAKSFPAIARLPYGVTYFRHPTGRCSDGRLVVDFLAEAFGLPLVPPFLMPGQSFRQGANFAFAGATALDVEFFEKRQMGGFRWSNNSLGDQLQWFQELQPSLCQTDGGCRELFGNSLFLVGDIGGNDYNYAIFAGETIDEVRSYVPMVVAEITSVTERLIGEGAMELMVPGSMPLGCSALYLTLFGSNREEDYESNTGCLKALNSFSRFHNTVLKSELKKLRKRYPQVKIVYADYYAATILFVRDPRHHGFRGGLKACCGGGGPYNFNVTSFCGFPGSTICSHPLEYANWDGVHLTEAAYSAIAKSLLDGTFTSPPLSAKT